MDSFRWQCHPKFLPNSMLPRLIPPFRFSFKPFSSLSTATTLPVQLDQSVLIPEPKTPRRGGRPKSPKVILEAQLKENWLNSLSCPFPHAKPSTSDWVVGIDPDTSGALALLKPQNPPQVFDAPQLEVLVGKRVRKRLDPKSMVQLIQSFAAPIGTVAFVEQSLPCPQDGKQGWWNGGFGYGLWIGILVASGFSVIPVPSLLWKNEFKLAGNSANKDGSRELASALFPSMASALKRKKDHGRAEALLIAAYGKGLKINSESSIMAEN